MKKIILTFAAAVWAVCLWAEPAAEAGKPAECSLPKETASVSKPANPPEKLSAEERKKILLARRKQIKKLVKQYKKAPEAEKPAIKAKLAEIVSEGVDAGIAYVEERIAAERANLDNWQAKIDAEKADLDQVKAQRVDDLLSGEAKRKYKAAKKSWKRQIKEAKKRIR